MVSIPFRVSAHLEMTGKILLVEGVVIHLDLREGPKVVWHKHDGDVHVLELPDGVVHAPHEYGEQRLRGAVQLALRMLHLEALRLCLGALRRR